MASSARSLRGKRKKKRNPCPNPLFVEWLKNWADDANEKGLKSAFTYRKAMKSLQRYPLPLASGKECKFLENIGDKICKMLDDKLAEHVARYGTTEPVNITEADEDADSSLLRLPDAGESADVTHLHLPPPPNSKNSWNKFGDSDSDGSDLLALPQKRRASGSREYIPKYRSGAYALIITLYNNMQAEASCQFMTKKELMTKSQRLADKSFSVPDPGCRYTAWSSMGSLIRKGYVVKYSSPAKYSLTDSGCKLADCILRAETAQDQSLTSEQIQEPEPDLQFTLGGGSHQASGHHPVAADDQFENCPPVLLIDDAAASVQDEESELQAALAMSSQEKDYGVAMKHTLHGSFQASRLKCWYVSEAGATVMQKDQAAVIIDDEISIGFLVKVKFEDLLMSGKRYKVDTTRGSDGQYMYAYIQDQDADELADPPNQDAATGAAPVCRQEINHNLGLAARLKMSLVSSVPPPSAQEHFPGKGHILNPTSHHRTAPATVASLPSNAPALKSKLPPLSPAKLLPPSAVARSSPGALVDLADVPSLSESGQSQDSQQSLASSTSSISSKFTLHSGTYDIILCVDNTEIYGKGTGKEALLRELRKSNIAMDVRRLQVGDFLWIARDRRAPACDSQKRELVLGYIIERKRMDDLAGSIVDGRFREQKFRMKSCGVKNQIYLVEAYGSTQNFCITEDALHQAVTNTQIIDGFYVKRTQDTKESAAYLAMLTRHLQLLHKNKTLVGSTKSEVEQYNKIACVQDQEVVLMTYSEFSECSVKTKASSVREMFGKQLVQLAGITVEKAAAIVEKYPTPSSLQRAYQQCISTAEAESLLTSVKFGAMKRSIGKALSSMVYRLYSMDALL